MHQNTRAAFHGLHLPAEELLQQLQQAVAWMVTGIGLEPSGH